MNMKRSGPRRTGTAAAVTALLALMTGAAQQAHAFGIQLPDPDMRLRWDNTVRYNAAWRAQGRNPAFYNVAGNDESEGRFDRGDMVVNRLDLFSEFDFSANDVWGFRLSGAAWREMAYGDKSRTNPDLTAAYPALTSNYGSSADYSSYAKRYVTRGSGELLDAFVFGNVDLGETSLRMKLGRHNIYWGDALFTAADGVSAGMGPVDTIKSATSPGAEVKELFLPVPQFSAQWTLSSTVSLQTYYQFKWKPFRLVPGGTYFATSDGGGNALGNDPACASAGATGSCVASLSAITPGDHGGDFGLAARLTPNWIGQGTLGLYYRRYDEKLPWSATQASTTGAASRLVYGRDTQMFGTSFTTSLAGFSVGSEISHRRNTALQSFAGALIGLNNGGTRLLIPLSQTPDYEQAEGARGNTWHALINGVKLLPQTSFWSSGTFTAELAFQHLQSVTKNAAIFYGEDYACRNGLAGMGLAAGVRGKRDGCASRNALGMNISFTPQWLQALPSWDFEMPTSLAYGLMGNGATLGGVNEGAARWSLGFRARFENRHEITLTYADSYAKYNTTAGTTANGGLPGQQVVSTTNGSAALNQRAWVGLTLKSSF